MNQLKIKIMKATLLFLFTLITTIVSAQTLVLDNLQNPGGIQIINNYLYYTEKLGPGQGKVSRIDITQSNPTIEVVYQGFNAPVHTAVRNSELYVLELSGGLYKLDLTQTNPTPEFMLDTATGSNRGVDLLIIDNFIYIPLYDDGKIVKVNLDDSFPTTSQDVITNLNYPHSLANNGNTIYFTVRAAGGYMKLVSVDLDDTNLTQTIIENDLGTALGILFYDNKIFCVEMNSNFKRISEIDLTGSFPTHSTSHINGLYSTDADLFLEGNTFYVPTHINPGGMITKYVSNTLTNNDFLIDTVNIYPNPAKNSVQISLKDTNFSVFIIIS